MSGAVSQQLELYRQQRSKVSINRYQYKELQSLVPNCWSNIRLLNKRFDKCSQLFDIPKEIPFNGISLSNGNHENTLPRKIDLMNQNQLNKLDNLITLFLDISMPYNTKKDVQTLIWYLIFTYQINSRHSNNLMLYILPRHLSSFYLEILQHLIFTKDSSLRAYKTNKNPSREYVTEITIKHFSNYQQLSALVRRLCIDLDMDDENSDLMAFYNSIQIELFNQSGGIRDNQLRFFISNALDALNYPKKRNYYSTYLCGISALVVKVNLSIEIQNDIINSLLKPSIDDNLQEILLLTCTILKHQSSINRLPSNWINLLISDKAYQNALFKCIVELIDADMDPFRFCELITITLLNDVNSDDSIDTYLELLMNLMSCNQSSSTIILTIINKLESISNIVNENLFTIIDDRLEFFPKYKYQLSFLYKLLNNISIHFPTLYNVLIRPSINSNEHFNNFLKMAIRVDCEIDPELELDSIIQYIDNISIFDSKKALNLINLSLDKFQYWSQSNEKLSLLASKLISLLPDYRSQILNSPNLWQFVSRLENRIDYIPILCNVLCNIMYEVDEFVIDCLCKGLISADKYQLFANDYILLEYCLTNMDSSQDLFTCLDILIQITNDYSLNYILGPISALFVKLVNNKNLNGILKSYISTLNSHNLKFNWDDLELIENYSSTLPNALPNTSPNTCPNTSPPRSIHILLEYLDYMLMDSLKNSGKIIMTISILFKSLDRVLSLSGISIQIEKIPLISTLVNSFTTFSTIVLSQLQDNKTEFDNWIIYNILTMGCTMDILHKPLSRLLYNSSINITIYALNLLNCHFKLGFTNPTLYKISNDGATLSMPSDSPTRESEFEADLADFIGETTYKSDSTVNNSPGFMISKSQSSLTIYKRLLNLFNMRGKDSSTSAFVLLLYLSPFTTRKYIETTLNYVRLIFDYKCNIDIEDTMRELVNDGFLLDYPLAGFNFNFPKSNVTNFISDLLNEREISAPANFLVVVKNLLSKYPRVAQSAVFISHFLPINILRNSKSFYSLIELRKSQLSFQLYSQVSKRSDVKSLAILLNILRMLSPLNERAKDRKYVNNYLRNVILPLSDSNSSVFIQEIRQKLMVFLLNKIMKYNILHHLEEPLLCDVILLLGKNNYGEFLYNIERPFKAILNLLSDDSKSPQITTTLVTMADYLQSPKILSELISKIIRNNDDVNASLFLSACKIASRFPGQIGGNAIQLVEMGIDFWWLDSKYSTETFNIFMNLLIELAKIYPEVSKFVLDNTGKLSNPIISEYKNLVSVLIKTCLSLGDVDAPRRSSASKTALLVWHINIDLPIDSDLVPIDYYIFSAQMIRKGVMDYQIYHSLGEADRVKIILAMSYFFNNIDLKSKFDLLSDLIIIESESGVLQITTTVQSDRGTYNYNKIGYIGDLAYNLLSLLTKYECPCIKRALKILISKTHLLLNTPHLILAILDYPYHYSPNDPLTFTDNVDLNILLELFKLLTNTFTFNTNNNQTLSIDGLKGLEVSNLYYRISYILSRVYEVNAHITLKSLIFLVKMGCFDARILRVIIYPMLIASKDLPRNDIYLLCKLVNLSVLLPRIDVVLSELGLSMVKALIEFDPHDPMICSTIANLVGFFRVSEDISATIYGLALASPANRKALLTALAKSDFGIIDVIFTTSTTIDASICGFNLIELFVEHFRGEITSFNPKITQHTVRLMANCSEFDSISKFPAIRSTTLASYINWISDSEDAFSKFHLNLANLLIIWFSKTTIFEMINVLQKLKSICDAKTPHHRHLYLYLLGNIIYKFKDLPKVDTTLLPLTIPIIDASLTLSDNTDLNHSTITLSLVVLASIKDFIIPGQLIPDIVNSLIKSISAIDLLSNETLGKRKRERDDIDATEWRNIIQDILITLLTDDNYELVSNALSKHLSIGNVFLKITIISALFNIWSKIFNSNDIDAFLSDRLGICSRVLIIIIKDLEFDQDIRVSTLAKKLGKKLESSSSEINIDL